VIEKTKTVYYCEHCKKHGLMRNMMERHERHCTLNPDRVCRWRFDYHSDDHPVLDLPALVADLRTRSVAPPGGRDPDYRLIVPADVEWLRGEVDGCPACMLAVFRQSGIEYHHGPDYANLWDYGEEVERFRARERAEREERQWEDDYRTAMYGSSGSSLS
jgi:hypothetical protein